MSVNHITNKKIPAYFEGFTPLVDCVVQDLGLMEAAVFGAIWRYCQMADGVCWASQETIGERLGITRRTTLKMINKLLGAGYLIDRTPDLVGKTHTYADSGKASIRVTIEGVKNLHKGCENNSQVLGNIFTPTCENNSHKDTLKDSLKDSNKNESIETDYNSIFIKETGILFNENGNKRWDKAIIELNNAGVTAEDLREGIKFNKENGYPILGLQSVVIPSIISMQERIRGSKIEKMKKEFITPAGEIIVV